MREYRENRNEAGEGTHDGHRHHGSRNHHERHNHHDGNRRHGENGRYGYSHPDSRGEDGHHSKGGRRGGGGHGSGHGSGHHGGGQGYLTLAEPEGTYLLFIGSRSCYRHKGIQKLQLQQEGKLSFLCLDEIDWITGAYLQLIEDAAGEIIDDLAPKHLILFGGCQVELLSTDYDAITKSLSEQYGTDVQFHRGCHLIGYGEDLEKQETIESKRGQET